MAAAVSSLASILKNANLDDHHELLRAANNAISKSKSDIQARHVKVIALLKLDRFDDALRTFEEAGDTLKEAAKLEHAYALYKAGELVAAAKIAQGAETRGLKHVLAQSSYRSENFEQAAQVYEDLASHNTGIDNDADLRINSLAVDAQLEWAGLGHLVPKKKATREDLDAFETSYNAACGSIARGDLKQAEILLRRARDLCNALDDLSDEDKLAETLPIMVQEIYVLTRQDKMEEAERLSANLPISSVPDLSTRKIAQSNILTAARQTPNPFLAHRLFHSTPEVPKSDTLFTYQSSPLLQNAYAIDLLSLKYDGVARSTSSYANSETALPTSTSVAPLSVINAASHAHSQTSKAAIKTLLPLLETRPRDAGLLLTIVHLYLLTNNYGSAISLFESFFKRLTQLGGTSDLDVRFAPGLIAAAVALYQKEGRRVQVKQELAKAAKYWRDRQKENGASTVELLRASGIALLGEHNEDDLQEAAETFESLTNSYPNDEAARSGRIAAYAKLNEGEIPKEALAAIPAAEKLIANLEDLAEQLENAGVPSAGPAVPITTSTKRKGLSTSQTAANRKKIRKSRMPKDYVEGKEVDKERWLPMRDRSYYRPKKRKGKGRAGAAGLTQGGIVDDDAAGSAPETKPVQSGGGGGGGQNKKKKNKGKGGKW